MAQQLIMIGPAAPARKTLNHDVQQRFLTYIDNWDYVGLVDEIERQDRAYGPEFTVSRINRALVSNWRARGIQMLLRTDREILRAAVMNELPRRALTNDPAQHISVRTAAMARTAGNDPVIYINWLADRQGNGLTLDEFKQLMAFLVSVLEGGDAAARVDSIWNNWTAGNRDGLMRGCTANERVKVTAFLHYHDTVTLPAMQRDRTIEQMMIPGEVGWAIDFRNRSAAHRILGSASPWMFRLVSCAIRHLFGTRFVMHQFVLFNVVTPEEAGIGESMASHLVASYANYGGFNFDQAAKTATRMHVMDPTETWLMIATRAFTQLHYFTHTDNNLRAWQAYNTRRYQAAKDLLTTIDTEAEYDAAKQKLNVATEEAESELVAINLAIEKADGFVIRLKQKAQRNANDSAAMDRLLQRLQELGVPGEIDRISESPTPSSSGPT